MSQFQKTPITFAQFIIEIEQLDQLPLSHMNPYFQKIDLHFGNYDQKKGYARGDFVLYVSGFWEVLDKNTVILNESHPADEIAEFFSSILGNTVKTIEVIEERAELFLELSNGNILHFEQETDGHWVELWKEHGILTFSNEVGEYWRDVPAEM